MEEDVRKAVEVLRRGGLILYPTDTVWGIGCDATNEAAVSQVYELKQRSDSKAMIVLTDNAAKVEFYVDSSCEVAFDLIELATTPLTIIYDNARNLAANLIAEDGTVGIRVTQEAFSSTLCKKFRGAIVSTSANISGQPTPLCFDDISQVVKDGVDYIVQYGRDKPSGKPSGIIKLSRDGIVKVIR